MDVLSVLDLALKVMAEERAAKQLEISQQNLDISRESLDIARESLDIARKNLEASDRSEVRDIAKLGLYTVKTRMGIESFKRATIDYTNKVFSSEDNEYTRRILRGHTKEDAFGYFLLWLKMENYKGINLDLNQAVLIANKMHFIDTNLIWNSYLDGTSDNVLKKVFEDIARINEIQNNFAELIAKVKNKEGRNQDNFIVEFELLDSLTRYLYEHQRYLDFNILLSINKEIIELLLAKITFHKYGLSSDTNINSLQQCIIQKKVRDDKYSDYYVAALSSIATNITKESVFRFISFVEHYGALPFLSSFSSSSGALLGAAGSVLGSSVVSHDSSSLASSIIFSSLKEREVERQKEKIEKQWSDHQYHLGTRVFSIKTYINYLPDDYQIWTPLLNAA